MHGRKRSEGKVGEPGRETAAHQPVEDRERYELLFEQSPVGVMQYDTDLRVNEVNQSFCHILMSDRDRLLGLDMRRLQDQRVLPALRAALKGKRGFYEGRYRATTSEAEIWIQLRTVAFHDARGEVCGGICIVENVTDRKQAEALQLAMYRLSEAAFVADDLGELFPTIHRILGDLMPTDNIYVALLDDERLHFEYFVDQKESRPPDNMVLGHGVTEYVLGLEGPLLASEEDLLELAGRGAIELRGVMPACWLGVPLRTRDEVIGVLALQSYDTRVRFDEHHKDVLSFVAEQVAMTVERKTHEADVQRMAYYDPLTGLANRRMLQEKAPEVLALAQRKGWSATLMYLDLDSFKKINDSLGHDAGDEVLVQIAAALQECVRESDLLVRLGGDEFAFLLPDTDLEGARRLAARISRSLDRPFVGHEEQVFVGSSIGIACSPEHGTSLEELLKHADIAMYRAKDQGSDHACYEVGESPYSRERLALEAELRGALEQRELELHYQPLLELGSDRVIGYEGLLRWPRAEGLVPAGRFISVAEECGLIRSLDRYVLRLALEGASRWLDEDQELALNLSTESLHAEALVDFLSGLLEETGFPPQRLILEVTESAALRNPETSYRTLEQIRDLGVRLAMDDFGSGFASLTYLRRMPLNRVKIDRGLVCEIGRQPRVEQLLRGAILMAQCMGLEVVAEGLEREEEKRWLETKGCQLVQGYLLGRPLSPESLARTESLVK